MMIDYKHFKMGLYHLQIIWQVIPNYLGFQITFLCIPKREVALILNLETVRNTVPIGKPDGNQTVSHMGNLTNYFSNYVSNKFNSFFKELFEEKSKQGVEGIEFSRDCEMKFPGVIRKKVSGLSGHVSKKLKSKK